MRRLIVALLLAPALASAAVPSQFSVQGVLRDKSGALQSAPINVSVGLFDAASAGNALGGPYLFSNAPAVNGLFNVDINDLNLPAALGAASAVWLEVTVGSDPPFSRQQLSSQVFALLCDTADHLRGVLPVAGGGTGSPIQSFVDLTTTQTIAGDKTFTNPISTRGVGISDAVQPTVQLVHTSAAADQKITEWMVDQGGNTFIGRFVNDAYTIASNFMQVTRVPGTHTVQDVSFPVGNVGIGLAGALAPLELANGIMMLDGRGLIAFNRYFNGSWRYRTAGASALIDTQSDGAGGINFYVSGSGTQDSPVNGDVLAMRITPTGSIGIGTGTPDATFTVNGTASKVGTTTWAVYSDERLKNIKGEYTAGLDEVMRLQPIRYEYKKDNALGIVDTGEHIGFSAQALQRVLPEAVHANDRGYLMVDSDPVIWSLLNAIKEQQREIVALRTRLDAIDARRGKR